MRVNDDPSRELAIATLAGLFTGSLVAFEFGSLGFILGFLGAATVVGFLDKLL